MSSEADYLSIVHQNALSRPEAVAFEHVLDNEITCLTYGDLIERVQQLGEALRSSGLGDGSRVAI